MQQFKIAIKARCEDLNPIRAFLMNHSARFVGKDQQKDTYFNVSHGRLKMREGNIENGLYHVDHSGQSDPNSGHEHFLAVLETQPLTDILEKALGIKKVVEKRREIYFIDNVKFHLDEVIDHGCFVEIEAVDIDDTITPERLGEQCCEFRNALGIKEEDILAQSYSELPRA
jgi:adenylate cyclase class 2